MKAGRQVLLQPLDLSFRPGEFVGILGPSGCGKSTLLRCLAGLQLPQGGEVRLDGQPLSSLPAAERRRIGFVPQDDVVHPSLRVERALSYSGKLLGLQGETLRQRVESILTTLELSERRGLRTDRLSGGQRKRVSIGVELLAEPRVLLLDEPTAGLDPALEESFMESCRRLAGQGRTLLMSTHVMQSLDTLDLVLILNRGHLLFLGTPAEALSFFAVPDLTRVYKKLAASDPVADATRFAVHPLHAHYIESRKTP